MSKSFPDDAPRDPREPDSPDLVNSATDPLRALVAECLARIEREGDDAIDRMCESHPEHASALRRRIDRLKRIGLVDTKEGPKEFPEKLGEFRLIRPLGGGGMGIVYLAEQEGLGRQVALKLIRPEHLYFPGAKERFRRECESVARLQHQGIVPIYTVGEENGIPYFAMEYVAGKTLAQCLEVLRQVGEQSHDADSLLRILADGEASEPKPDRASSSSGTHVLRGRWVEVCLRIVREVAIALDHAHERGVLHRDLKPSNILITKSGRVMLFDFGLALSRDATRLTQSGALVGSMPYMAPEQVRGKVDEIGPATDVYGLGVTLYELMTLALPFRAKLSDELQREILEGRPDPPSQLNSAIPWDAETVCLTAIDSDPNRRYRSAAEFARDLTNVLEHRPITAKRPGALLRIHRFTQRRPALSVALGLGFLLLVGGPALFGILERQRRLEVNALNSKLAESLREATEQRKEAQANFEKAIASVDLMLSEVGSRELENIPLMEGVRRRLLERALDFYRSFLVDRGEDVEVLRRAADALRRIGSIEISLGQDTVARQHLDEALQRFDDLSNRTQSPLDEMAAIAVKSSLSQLELMGMTQNSARATIDDLRSRLERRVAQYPDDLAAQLELARTFYFEGAFLRARSDLAGAEQAFRAATKRSDQLATKLGREPEVVDWWSDLGLAIMQQENAYPDRATEIEQVLTRALAVANAEIEREPEAVDSRLSKVVVLQNLAGHYRRLERLDDAEKVYRDLLADLESITTQFPERIESRRELAHTLNNLGLICELGKRTPEAEEYYGKAVERLTALRMALPSQAEIAAHLGIAHMNHAICANMRGDRSLEIDRLKEARRSLREAIDMNPSNDRWRLDLFNALGGLEGACLALARHLDVVTYATEATEVYAKEPRHATRPAMFIVRAIALAKDDESLTAAEREVTVKRYGDQAVKLMRKAKELGFSQFPEMFQAPEIAVLDGNEEFAKFKAEIEQDSPH